MKRGNNRLSLTVRGLRSALGDHSHNTELESADREIELAFVRVRAFAKKLDAEITITGTVITARFPTGHVTDISASEYDG